MILIGDSIYGKMGGTVHLAIGSDYSECSQKVRKSAVHIDLITDMAQKETGWRSTVRSIQQNGLFQWEEGFEG